MNICQLFVFSQINESGEVLSEIIMSSLTTLAASCEEGPIISNLFWRLEVMLVFNHRKKPFSPNDNSIIK